MPIGLIATSFAEYLVQEFAQDLNFKIFTSEKNKDGKRIFPDGETYGCLPQAEIISGRTVILHTGAPRPDQGLMELETLLEILRDTGADPVEIFFTYFPYGQQDHVFKPGEVNVAERLIQKFVRYYNVKKMYILDAHFNGRPWTQAYPIHNVTAVPLLQEQVKKDFPQIILCAPDAGGARRTGLPSAIKQRRNSRESSLELPPGVRAQVNGRDVGVLDDLLETGGTLEKFHAAAQQAGAKNIVALVTHGVLPEGIARVQAKFSKLYLTNSIDRCEANVGIASLVREHLIGGTAKHA